MITLDTSGVFALLSREDPYHRAASAALRAEAKPYLLPVATLGEATYLIESRLSAASLDTFLADLEDNRFTLECGDQDVS